MKTLLYKSFLLVLSAHFAQALFKHRMQGVQEKAKGYFKSQFGKSSMNFMGLESSDYPGTNAEYRKINRDKWQVYYECLALRQRALEQHHTIPPEAKVAVVGGYVKSVFWRIMQPDKVTVSVLNCKGFPATFAWVPKNCQAVRSWWNGLLRLWAATPWIWWNSPKTCSCRTWTSRWISTICSWSKVGSIFALWATLWPHPTSWLSLRTPRMSQKQVQVQIANL